MRTAFSPFQLACSPHSSPSLLSTMGGNSSHYHTTEDELRYVQWQIGRAAGLLQFGKYSRLELLRNYINAAKLRDWNGLDGERILDAAKHELMKEEAKANGDV